MAKLTNSPRLNHLLYQMEIFNEYDVINHLPRRYEDFSLSKDSAFVEGAKVTVKGKIISLPRLNKGRRVSTITFDFMSSDNKYYRVQAYNRPYLIKTITINEEYTINGTYSKSKNTINLNAIVKGAISEGETLKPIYSLPSDYPNHLFAGLVEKELNALHGKIYSNVPYYYQNKYKLIDKELALRLAHKPRDLNDIKQALRHLKYEEALTFSLKNQLIRNHNKSLKKIKKEPIDIDLCQSLIDSLPYKLTEDQYNSAKEIIEDMNQPSLMYRMLQGDVGSGKTLVSFIALYANHLRGDQGALMAPTDVLARQHYENAKKIFEGTKIKIALLVGATSQEEKRRLYDDIKDGYIDIVIGTHALFTKSVQYSSLGLVVIDEQHRFGVNQRKALAEKGDSADILMMSATPIPRSLALTLYGDLDISTLTKFPNQKRDVKTLVLDSESERIFKAVDYALENNHQVYIVAPLIDYSSDERYSVEKLFELYKEKYGEKVGLLHGKMSAKEKNEALERFASSETPILVSTQVIEVGIDVKNANIMVIYDASNFGLASLHQLRGRIGRDGSTAYCILTYDESSESASVERLNLLCRTNDGFEIAEFDMKNRGPGELVGVKQSGFPSFQFVNMVDDVKIFLVARDDAKYIIDNVSENKSFKYIVDKINREINTLEE